MENIIKLVTKKLCDVTFSQTILLLFGVLSFVITAPFCFDWLHVDTHEEAATSVWCRIGFNLQKTCQFKDICYSSDSRSLLFNLNSKSVLRGLKHYSDLQNIQLSTINFHNQFFANISMIDGKTFNVKNVEYIEAGIMFSRFKPDNIMHVIHDDLFPLFLTLDELCMGMITECISKYRLILDDKQGTGPYFDLYRLFSMQEPLFLNELTSKDNLICFRKLTIGLNQESLVYQYGFNIPHGPVSDPGITYRDVVKFTNFVREKLNIEEKESNFADVVLVSRKKSRRILNEDEVREMLKTVYQNETSKQIRLRILDLATNKTRAFIEAVTKADILVGMHGAEMILSIFLKPQSAVVEMFPYGIQPNVVSFLKPLFKLEGSQTVHIDWRNMNNSYSVTHSDAHPLYGGISHLSPEMQLEIKYCNEVPPVECCNNPNYLFHMFQDTWIPHDFAVHLARSLTEVKPREKQSHLEKWFYPFTVSNLTCSRTPRYLNISWLRPFNVNSNFNVHYNIFVVDKNNANFKQDVVTKKTNLFIEIPANMAEAENVKFHLWISCALVNNQAKSPNVFYECL